jgi:hypothetical protein
MGGRALQRRLQIRSWQGRRKAGGDRVTDLMQRLDDKKKLVKCWMVNPSGEGRHRFVELENFRLWEYLVTTKHGMTIQDVSVCLWLSEPHFQYNRNLFEHAGSVSEVDQVTIERYDPNYKFCNLIHRYGLSDETEDLVARLKAHIKAQGPDVGDWQMTITRGRGIEPDVGELVEPIALGIV